jgi:hypothetical protein
MRRESAPTDPQTHMAKTQSSARANRKLEEKFRDIYAQYRKEADAGRYDNALRLVRSAQKFSADPMIFHSEALCLWKLGQQDRAYALCKRIDPALHGKQTHHHDLMCDICAHTDRHEEGKIHGSMALKLRADAVKENKAYAINFPPPGKSDGRAKIIAYTLFGAQPRYCEVAIANCDAAAALMPGWVCRFYVDATVPADVLRRLRAKGAQVVQVDEETRTQIHPLMWRFLVADDPSVSRFAVRDADSLIGPREAAAVSAWLESDSCFHIMRDWPSHCELMLAGLWGGCTGAIPSMRDEIIDFLQKDKYASSHVDQYFLRNRIWPTARQSVLSHDSQFTFPGNQPFPVVPDAPVGGVHHIGANLSTGKVRMAFDAADGTLVEWSLVQPDGEVFCTYEAIVRNGHYETNLPNFLLEKIRAGELKVRAQRRGG